MPVPEEPGRASPIEGDARVAALVPHYRCEAWVGDALGSLLEQSRPLDAVIVIDDASPDPPIEIVRSFPGVALLTAAENSGPYRLVQTVIETTDYDAYLFQDADDWSSPDRLGELLALAEETGAELVGSQEARILCDEGRVVPVGYPLDVNAALREHPASFPLLHPTSLVGRGLVMRLGGFASGLRISGDGEFLRRAAHAARIVNSPRTLYYRRERPGALTMDPETGLRSANRREVEERLWTRARENAARAARGEPVDLGPVAVAPRVSLTHVAGPAPAGRAQTAGSENGEARAARLAGRPAASAPALGVSVGPSSVGPRPVFVVGAPRSGGTLLAWSLAQHPALSLVVDSRWLSDLTRGLWRALDGDPPGGADAWLGEMASALAPGIDARARAAAADASGKASAARWMDATPENATAIYGLRALFPSARFLHVTREPAEAVTALIETRAFDGRFHAPDAAVANGLELARAALEAERALGSGVVLRVEYAELVGQPEATLRRCLEFLGEPFDPRCLRPLRGVGTAPASTTAPSWLATPEARAWAGLLAEPRGGTGDSGPVALDRLREAFLARCRQGFEGSAARPLARRVREVVLSSVPEGKAVAVVTRGDDALLSLGHRSAWHFPRLRDGTYAGHHPADSAEAVAHLDAARRAGAEYLVVPATSMWWLHHYEGLREHLEREARLVAWHEGTCAVFALDGPGADRPEGWLSAVLDARRTPQGAAQ